MAVKRVLQNPKHFINQKQVDVTLSKVGTYYLFLPIANLLSAILLPLEIQLLKGGIFCDTFVMKIVFRGQMCLNIVRF